MALEVTKKLYGAKSVVTEEASDPFKEHRGNLECGDGEVPCMTQSSRARVMALEVTKKLYGAKSVVTEEASDPFKEHRGNLECGDGEVPCMTQIQPGMSVTTIEIPAVGEVELWWNVIHQLQCANGLVILRGVGQTVWDKDLYVMQQDMFCELVEICESRPMFVVAVCKGDVRSAMMTFPAVASVALAEPDATFGFPDLRLGGMPAVMSYALKRRCGEQQIRKMVMTGDIIDSSEAQRIGLIDFVGDTQAEVARLIFRNCRPTPVYYMWKPDVEAQQESGQKAIQ
eukprot:CAMPEP_0169170332 /NCGR_PEP_ID=MMETSP1015-20121227/62102_1 /TAXON_ID=342587 /ORGANISM="Karlodinium micrum, Strain CCMP2283" /LENGTH=284 /DNA_ID=CAMNT_0009243409 /DNA_START=35 /DNA_END=890 /DNA_ORIENTATION=+